ncbi:MAG: universal stress protein [Pseudomonadales bacterium]
MSDSHTVLLAIDLSDEAEHVASKALSLAKSNNATLHIIHVIEPLSFAYGGDIPMDFSGIQDEIQKQAQIQLADFSTRHGIPEAQQHIAIGRPEKEIHSMAEELDADLIVVGSHGRHGLALLLGSTANGVLHRATCDVLAVRVGKR